MSSENEELTFWDHLDELRSTLVRIIGVAEIIMSAERFSKQGFIWPLFSTGLFFLAMCGLLTLLFNHIEKKLNYYHT